MMRSRSGNGMIERVSPIQADVSSLAMLWFYCSGYTGTAMKRSAKE